MASNRCPDCLTDWPIAGEFSRCPRCRIPCEMAISATAMLLADAKAEVNRIKFDRLYEKREEKRIKRGDLSPEQIGAIEAREINKLNRALKAE